MLNTVIYPASEHEDSVPLIIGHGLFGSARNWGVIARRLATRRDVIAIDQRNHGTSPRTTTHSYADLADDLAEVIQSHGGVADVLGHSMGGKAAMYLALTQGQLLRKLVVADIAPVAYSHDQSRHIHAMRALDLHNISTRGEADRRLAEAVEDPSLRAFFLQSLDLGVEPAVWRLNLDVLEASMSQIVGWPQVEGVFDGPTLFVTGADSSYVLPDSRDAIRQLFPKAQFAKIPGAGHWLHAERPREFEQAVEVFLNL